MEFKTFKPEPFLYKVAETPNQMMTVKTVQDMANKMQDQRFKAIWNNLNDTQKNAFANQMAERANKSFIAGHPMMLSVGGGGALGAGLGYLFGDGKGAALGGLLGALVGFFAEMMGLPTEMIYKPILNWSMQGKLQEGLQNFSNSLAKTQAAAAPEGEPGTMQDIQQAGMIPKPEEQALQETETQMQQQAEATATEIAGRVPTPQVAAMRQNEDAMKKMVETAQATIPPAPVGPGAVSPTPAPTPETSSGGGAPFPPGMEPSWYKAKHAPKPPEGQPGTVEDIQGAGMMPKPQSPQVMQNAETRGALEPVQMAGPATQAELQKFVGNAQRAQDPVQMKGPATQAELQRFADAAEKRRSPVESVADVKKEEPVSSL